MAGAARNQFGLDFKAAGLVWTKALCEKDSDGDGVSNGQELGDPCCLWTVDNPAPKGFRTTSLSHPGEKSEAADAATCSAAAAGGDGDAATTTAATTTAATTAASGGGSGSDDDGDDATCFPGSATVQLESGAAVRMDALAVGDRVLAAPGAYSPVFLFTHRAARAPAAFLRISTDAGAAVAVTPGHYVPVRGRGLVAARAVAVGDYVGLGDGREAAVLRVEAVRGEGLYNPQTLHGEIVVDGVVCSAYTQAVEPAVAHAALGGLRAVWAAFGVAVGGLEDGSPVGVPAVLGGEAVL